MKPSAEAFVAALEALKKPLKTFSPKRCIFVPRCVFEAYEPVFKLLKNVDVRLTDDAQSAIQSKRFGLTDDEEDDVEVEEIVKRLL